MIFIRTSPITPPTLEKLLDNVLSNPNSFTEEIKLLILLIVLSKLKFLTKLNALLNTVNAPKATAPRTVPNPLNTVVTE